MNEKLTFNKETVAKLSDDNMSQVNGGAEGFISLGRNCTTWHDCCMGNEITKGLFCGVRDPK